MAYRLVPLSILLVILSAEAPAAPPSACVVNSPRYLLASDSVDWSIKIKSGQTCVRGLRFGSVVIETVKLITAPQSGNVRLLGPGFSYTPKPDFVGEDSFTVAVSGTINKVHGTSTIRVVTLVSGASDAPPLTSIEVSEAARINPSFTPYAVPEGTFTPLHLYYISPTGRDSNNGLTPATAWATPHHNVVCGDVIIVAAGSYGNFGLGTWGTVSNCPSSSGGIDGTGGIYFAVLLCAGPNMMSCQFNGTNWEAFRVDQSNWAVEGFWATQNTGGNGGCFNGENDVATQHYLAFINDIASVCDLDGFATSGGGCGIACGSFDMIAAVGVVAYNAANSLAGWLCGSGIAFIPGPATSATGTHVYVAGFFGAYNANASGTNECTASNQGSRGWPHSDGSGVIFDTYGAGYSGGFYEQAVLENAVIWHSGSSCVQVFPQGNGSTNDQAQYHIQYITCFANGQDPRTGCNGDVYLNGIYPTGLGTYQVHNNIILATMTSCGGAGLLANFPISMTGNPAHVVSLTNPPITVSGNWIWQSAPPTTTTAGPPNTWVVDNRGAAPVFNARWMYGTNTYNNPGLTNPTALFSRAPNCAGYSNVTDCMLIGYSVYNYIKPTIAPTTIGYQPPGPCAPNPYYPKWLKGIVYLQWNPASSTVTEKSGLVTKPCGL
jgi:hypothetical protein